MPLELCKKKKKEEKFSVPGMFMLQKNIYKADIAYVSDMDSAKKYM